MKCQNCGSHIVNNGRCMTCGALVSQPPHNGLPRLTSIDAAVAEHFQKVEESGVRNSSMSVVVTTIKIDGVTAFRIVTNSSKIGMCYLASGSQIIPIINFHPAGWRFINSNRASMFGNEAAMLADTLQALTLAVVRNGDASRITVDTTVSIKDVVIVSCLTFIYAIVVLLFDAVDDGGRYSYTPYYLCTHGEWPPIYTIALVQIILFIVSLLKKPFRSTVLRICYFISVIIMITSVYYSFDYSSKILA